MRERVQAEEEGENERERWTREGERVMRERQRGS